MDNFYSGDYRREARQAANLIEEGEMCGKLPEKSTGEKFGTVL